MCHYSLYSTFSNALENEVSNELTCNWLNSFYDPSNVMWSQQCNGVTTMYWGHNNVFGSQHYIGVTTM